MLAMAAVVYMITVLVHTMNFIALADQQLQQTFQCSCSISLSEIESNEYFNESI